MDVRQLADGLWRWTAEHPSWTEASSGWERTVACFYHESRAHPDDPIVLFDPLVPPDDTEDGARYWRALGRDLDRTGRPLSILVGNRYHGRSARRVRAWRGGEVPVHVPAGTEADLGLDDALPCRGGDRLPGGIRAFAIEALSGAELAWWIEEHRALVFADAVLGTGDGAVRLAPPDWADEEHRTADGRRRFRASVGALIDLDPVMLLTGHGEPVLANGREALIRALSPRPAPRRTAG